MEDERIKAVKNWLKPKSIKDIQVFIKFVNFYWQFIQSFSTIAAPLILMLKIIITSFIGYLHQAVNAANRNSGDNGNRNSRTLVKSKILLRKTSATEKLNLLTSKPQSASNCLQLAFTKAPIF